ncbi:DGQHR domain-containing protein [Caulobacter sp. 17J80-11]|uniref:DGQHR domain-containing protein n=1 Tax=Caulobacter sp. 17J80-11 TaxID=2763502 RepID=UPI001653B55D|nr:DGQHR domain-containing protein [Caulobacter sp. 17J80-11]MBC6983790.1 DGQHR domain-containing protein [Caulobacter sp. 17J80-11]
MNAVETEVEHPVESYTFSLIRQGRFRFYSLTLPSTVLAETCFVTTRYEDPMEGFQRILDEKRAEQIAQYVDSEGTIPSSIVLSAQAGAKLTVKPGGRALTFVRHPHAFLVLDGQHRVFGFSKAKSEMRVPVIIYDGLTRQQETRLFIDINTKQKPVPNELLLDIKHLADIESDEESRLRDIFDSFATRSDSILFGLLSPSERAAGKLSRVSFNSACKPILPYLGSRDSDDLYSIINAYLGAFVGGLDRLRYRELLILPYGFKAIMGFFPDVAGRVKGRFSGEYTATNFADVLDDVFSNTNRNALVSAKNSSKQLQDLFGKALTKGFKL